MATLHLGPLVGGRFEQYANAIGQVYYQDTVAGTESYIVPNGFEDRPGDTWIRDTTKSWTQWKNTRTGRAVFIDPNPPPPQTYLDVIAISTGLNLLVRVLDSDERLYRMPLAGILQFFFPVSEGYSFILETTSPNIEPGFCLSKISQPPGGTPHDYDYMLVECKEANRPWASVEDHLHSRLRENRNPSKNCYGMVQIGLHVQFYKYEDFSFGRMGGRMHMIHDAEDVMAWGKYVKDNPMSFV